MPASFADEVPAPQEKNTVSNPRLRNSLNRETRETREKSRPFPRKLSGFAYFAYFAVPSVFYIGTVFELPYFSRSSCNVASVRRGFATRRARLGASQFSHPLDFSLSSADLWKRGTGRQPPELTTRLAPMKRPTLLLPLLRRLVKERAGERRLPPGSWAGGPFREPLSLSLSPLRGARGPVPEHLAKNCDAPARFSVSEVKLTQINSK